MCNVVGALGEAAVRANKLLDVAYFWALISLSTLLSSTIVLSMLGGVKVRSIRSKANRLVTFNSNS